MQLSHCILENFASYERLEFDFSNQGLALIHGPTGAGKSTLCDAIPWVLFGRTAKGGTVDEVLTWPGDKITSGTLTINSHGESWTVTRIRGPKAKDNDLYLQSHTRGKDLPDTQRLINARLGVSYELYLSGAYFHEFSQTAQFFTTTAKNRRTLLEQVVDLSMAKTLQDRLAERAKDTAKRLSAAQTQEASAEAQHASDTRQTAFLLNRYAAWESERSERVGVYLLKSTTFEQDKIGRIDALERRLKQMTLDLPTPQPERYKALTERLRAIESHMCKECGGPMNHAGKEDLQREVYELRREGQVFEHMTKEMSSIKIQILEEKSRVNTYGELLEAARQETNPHDLGIRAAAEARTASELALKEAKAARETLVTEADDLELMKDVVSAFRSTLVKNTIAEAERRTNDLLTNYFDGELRTVFDISADDKLEAGILKNGYDCSYTQLSKGQRQLLKLCFSVAVMECVSNHHGVSFGQLFFDEALDGLDEQFKGKAYRLLEALSLSHDSVLVVEHSSELKASFVNQFRVKLSSEGRSEIEKS